MKAKKLLQELIETIKSAKHYPKEVLIEDLEAILNSFETKKESEDTRIEKLHNTNSNKCWCNPTIINPLESEEQNEGN